MIGMITVVMRASLSHVYSAIPGNLRYQWALILCRNSLSHSNTMHGCIASRFQAIWSLDRRTKNFDLFLWLDLELISIYFSLLSIRSEPIDDQDVAPWSKST